ncbi:MAG: hypothetical protein SFV54_01470 [Bryobacteraceae bacterium]|nr:hypothetical protein [Bryobacteraceae bacterium]
MTLPGSGVPVTVVAAVTRVAVPRGTEVGAKRGEESVPGPGRVTAKAEARVACWAPVRTVTVRGPGAAEAVTWSWAVAVVGVVTVTGPKTPSAVAPTAMPGPKLACVEPWTKLVNWPVRVTARARPAVPEEGVTAERRAGGLMVRVALLALVKATAVVVTPETETR